MTTYTTLKQIIDQLESCDFKSETGPLEKNAAFIALKKMAYEKINQPNTGWCEVKGHGGLFFMDFQQNKKPVEQEPDYDNHANCCDENRITLQRFAHKYCDGLYTSDLDKDSQCGGWYYLKIMVEEKRRANESNMQPFHPNLRKLLIERWGEILKMEIEK